MNTTKVLLDSPITITRNDKSGTKLISYPKGWVEIDNADLNDPFVKAHILEIAAQLSKSEEYPPSNPTNGKEDPPNNLTNADQGKSQLKAGGNKGGADDKNGDNQGK